MVFTFLSLLDWLGVAPAFPFLNSSNQFQTSDRHDKLRKIFGKLFGYFVSRICFGRKLSRRLLRWSSLQTKEGQIRSKFCLVGLLNSHTPSTSRVWPSNHREDHRSCACPFYSLYRPLPNVTRHSGWWPHTVTPSIDRTLHQFLTITDLDLITEFDFLPNCTRFP